MSGTADPWQLPQLPAMQTDVEHKPDLELTPGPERIYDRDAADPEWSPRPVGFTAQERPL